MLCRTDKYEYGVSQDWVFGVKLIYKNLFQEKRLGHLDTLVCYEVLPFSGKNTLSVTFPAFSAHLEDMSDFSLGCQYLTSYSSLNGLFFTIVNLNS